MPNETHNYLCVPHWYIDPSMHSSTDRLTLHLLNIIIYLFTMYVIFLLQFYIQYSNYVQYSDITKILH